MSATLSDLIKAQARLWMLTEQLDPAIDPATLDDLTARVKQIVSEVQNLTPCVEEQLRLFAREWL